MIKNIIASVFLAFVLSSSVFANQVHTLEILSDVYEIDKIYNSMFGPKSTVRINVGDKDTAEFIWIVGYEAIMNNEKGDQQESQEFMCHSNLDFRAVPSQPFFTSQTYLSDRVFTLSQGQSRIDFPKGFGIPISSRNAFKLNTQVLNLNPLKEIKRVRHKVKIFYVRNDELTGPMKPLFFAAANGLVVLDGNKPHYNIRDAREEIHGPGCLPGVAVQDEVRPFQDGLGRKFSAHWKVPPGRQENHTLVSDIMRLPYDTTLHYAAIHLHPYSEYIELRDLTENKVILHVDVTPQPDKVGIAHVDHFSSEEGIMMYKDHQYELTSVYNNTTDEDVDSMAVIYMYLRDKSLKLNEILK